MQTYDLFEIFWEDYEMNLGPNWFVLESDKIQWKYVNKWINNKKNQNIFYYIKRYQP